MKKRSQFGTSARGPIAFRPSALSIYWEWGCGKPNEVIGPCAVVNISGPLEQRASWFDGYDAIIERFRDALASDSPVVLLRIDSPGGECAGLIDCVAKMRALAASLGSKRIVAFADETAYSAAYAIACAAGEIYVPRSGGVGSVGVIAVVADQVAWNEQHGFNVAVIANGDRKADCHPDVPLSAEALAGVREDVDTLAEHFRALVSESRGIADTAIAALEAGTFMGEAAIAAGLADGVMSFDELISMLASDTSKPAAVAATAQGSAVMPPKKAKKKIVPLDAMSAPMVATIDPNAFKAIAGRLGATKAAEEEDAEGDDECTTSTTTTTEDVSEDGTTTTTTDQHTETTVTPASEDDEEEEGDDEESDEGEEAAAAPPRLATKTSGDVLALVKSITGRTSPGEQIGALTAMRDQAATVKKSKRAAREAAETTRAAKLAATVDGAIRAGKLAPSQRAWAMGAGLDVVNGYLSAAPGGLVRTAEASSKPAIPKAGLPSSAFGAALAEISKNCGQDPAAVLDHATKLAAAGVISVH